MSASGSRRATLPSRLTPSGLPSPRCPRSRPLALLSAATLLALALALWPGAGLAQTPALTSAERDHIQGRGPVRLCVDPDWIPFEWIDETGRHQGIAADIIQLLAERTGLRFELVRTASWDESLAASQDGRCQVLSFLNDTPKRREWLIFTEPLFTDSNVFITREEHPFISDPAALTRETIVFPRGTSMEERVRRDYPNLSILVTETENEAVNMVSDRKADMTMRSLIVAAYAIKKEGLFNLKIAGQLPNYENKLRMGVANGDTALRDIIDKALATVTKQEIGTIVNKHVSINVQTVTDYRFLARVLFGVALLAMLGGFWAYKIKKYNRALRREIARREELEKLRDDVEQIIRHDLISPLNGIINIPEILNSERNLTEKQREMLNHVKYAGLRLLANIRMASDLIKMEKGEYTVSRGQFDLHNLLRQIAMDLKGVMDIKNVTMRTVIDGREVAPGASLVLDSSETLFFNMLENLVKNACEAAPHDSQVTIDLDTRTMTLGVHNLGEVPEPIRRNFFDKYVTYGKRTGTGLGTYSAKMIALTLGGAISLDASVPGQTTVRVRLPDCRIKDAVPPA